MAVVTTVSKSPTHSMIKKNESSINLIEDIGVEGDVHAGKTVKHEYIVKKDPTRLNLRQVHLIHSELHEELNSKGFSIKPGEMGENITTSGIDLLNLPKNTILNIGETASIQITGLRSPCSQLNGVAEGLLKAVIDKDAEGNVIMKAGIMSIVLKSGVVAIGDKIEIILSEKPHQKMEGI